MRFGIICALMLAIGCGGVSPESTTLLADEGPSWPVFHGPNCDNKSPETGLLQAWPEDGPTLLWRTEGLGDGYSTVTTESGRLFTSGNLNDESTVVCMDLDGKIAWTYGNGPAWTKNFPATRSTPTLDGERVYDFSPSGQVVCLNAANGNLIWTKNVLDVYGGKTPTWALAESVRIDGDKLICTPAGSKASVVALDKMTGEEIWAAAPTGEGTAGYNTVTLCEQDGLPIVLTMTGKALIGVNADTGEMLFTFPHQTSYDVNATDPIYADGKIFITSGYGTTGAKLLELTVDGDSASVEEVWHNPEFDNQHGGVVLHDGYLYGSGHKTGRGSWFCVDWQTGETVWKERGVGMGSLTYADNMLYTWDESRGNVALVKASPDAYEVTGEFQVPADGKGKRWAHPVVIGGKLYLRHGDYLYCYDVSAK